MCISAASSVQAQGLGGVGLYDNDRWDDNTVVTTKTPTISMTANFQVMALPAGQTATYGSPAQGHSGQTLHVHVHVA